jgi:hypothetical protein
VDNDGLRYGAMESALRPSLPTAARSDPSRTETSSHFAEAQIHVRLTNPAKPNIITSIRGSTRQVAEIKSEPRPASNRNRWPASYWNAWPASSESAVENIWQYLRANWLSNRVFETYDDIVDAACQAWRNLIAQPQTITSIGMRQWAHVGQSL